MKPQAICVSLCFSATALAAAVGSAPLARVTTSISSLGDQVSRIDTTLQELPAFVANDTDPQGLFSAASGLLSNLNSAVEAMKAHGDFSTEDANVILGEFQKIEPVISSVMDSIGTRTKILIELHTDEIPARVLQDLERLGSACREFRHTLGESVQMGVESPLGIFSRATETISSAVPHVVRLVWPCIGCPGGEGERK